MQFAVSLSATYWQTELNTSSTLIFSMQLSLSRSQCVRPQGLQSNCLYITVCPSPHGLQTAGEVGPNKAITLVPEAVAICVGPLSFPTNRAAFLSNAARSRMLVLPAMEYTGVVIMDDKNCIQIGKGHVLN